MKLYETYPEAVELDGRRIELDLDFRNVLRVLDLSSGDWTERERTELSLCLLLKDPAQMPRTWAQQEKLLTAIFAIFPREEGETQSTQRYLDFTQDAGKIRSAFYRIGIDLTKDSLHFFQFLELLADLPADTALMRTIEIRQRPIPKPNKHNGDEIAALTRAKARVAIKMSDEESRARFAASLKKSW